MIDLDEHLWQGRMPQWRFRRGKKHDSSDVSCSQLLSITVSTFHPDIILISLHLHPLE